MVEVRKRLIGKAAMITRCAPAGAPDRKKGAPPVLAADRPVRPCPRLSLRLRHFEPACQFGGEV
ncbi:MAG TPA: hypothetical protein PKJ44_10640, partial [Thauera aminoaromatica]|nr:hypothetical protein [Thauera aminoaromatica]